MFLAPEVALEALEKKLDEVRATTSSPRRGRINEDLAKAAKDIVSSGQSLSGTLSGTSRAGRFPKPRSNPRTSAWLEQLAQMEATSPEPTLVGSDDGLGPSKSTNAVTSATSEQGVSRATRPDTDLTDVESRKENPLLNAREVGSDAAAESSQSDHDDTSDDFEHEHRLVAADALLKTGINACEEQDWANAEAYLKDTLSMLPQLPTGLRGKYDLFSLRYRLALCAFHLYDADTAEEPLRSVVKRRPHSMEQAVDLCEAGSMLSQVYIRQGKLEAARSACESSCEVLKKFVGKHHGSYCKSLALLSRIYQLQNKPRLADVYINMIPANGRQALLEPYATISPPQSPIATAPERASSLFNTDTTIDMHSLRSVITSNVDPSMQGVEFQPYTNARDNGSPRPSTVGHGSRSIRVLKGVKPVKVLKRPADQGHVSALAFAPNRRLRAASITNRSISLWETYEWTKAQSTTLRGHEDTVQATAFSPDGQILVSVAIDKTARVWPIATEAQARKLIYADKVYAVAFSPDGKRLATGSENGSVRLWNTESGTSVTGDHGRDRVDCVAFSPDSNTLASRASDGMITMWDIGNSKPIHTFGHKSPERDDTDLSRHRLLFSTDGSALASWGSDDVRLILWDPVSGAKKQEMLHPKGRGVRDITFIPGSNLLVSASSDEKTRIWDMGTSKKVLKLDRIVESLAASLDGRLLAMSLYWDRKVMLFELIYQDGQDASLSPAAPPIHRMQPRMTAETDSGFASLEGTIAGDSNTSRQKWSKHAGAGRSADSSRDAPMASPGSERPVTGIDAKVKRALESSLLPSHSMQYAIYDCRWRMASWMQQLNISLKQMHGALTVTGNNSRAYAVSYEEYVRKMFPTVDRALLTEIENPTDTGAPNKIDISSKFVRVLRADKNGAAFEASGDFKWHYELARQLAWATATCRPSEEIECLVSFKKTSAPDLSFEIWGDPVKHSELPSSSASCWQHLLKGVPMVCGFGVPERSGHDFKGLEISYDLMLKLVGATHAVTIDGACFVMGQTHILIPCEVYRTADDPDFAVQWHLHPNKNPSGTVMDANLQNYRGQWAKVHDINTLRSARTFLGYCSESKCNLGSQQSGYDQLKYADLDDERGAFQLGIKAFTIGTSGAGFFTAEAQLGVRPAVVLQDLPLETLYEEKLRAACSESLLLYDAAQGSAWLVSMISVMHHLALSWIHGRARSRTLASSLQVAASHDAATASFQLLRQPDTAGMQLPGFGGGEPYQLRHLLDRIWHTLVAMKLALQVSKARIGNFLACWPAHIAGWQWLSIINGDLDIYTAKRVPLPSSGFGWEHLINHMPLLVGADLGNVIEATPSALVCDTWRGAVHKYSMTASVSQLERLSERRGRGRTCSQLADRAFWHHDEVESLFQLCDHEGAVCPKRLQNLERRSGVLSNSIPPSGAVRFGKNRCHRSRSHSSCF